MRTCAVRKPSRNGQLYSLAHDREQASVLFKLMTAMIYMDEELSERLNVVESRKRLVDPVSGSEFTALSSETRGKHGKSSSFIVFDELAQFGADRELYDVMMTSRARTPIRWCGAFRHRPPATTPSFPSSLTTARR